MSYQSNTNALASPVDWTVPVTLSDLAPGNRWPPERLRARADRAELLSKLWHGALADLVNSAVDQTPDSLWGAQGRPSIPPGPNYVLAAGKRVADILLASPPVVTPDLADLVGQELYQSATEMCRMGGSVILRVGDSVQAVSPEGWYVLAEGGHVIVSFSTSAQAYNPDPDRMTAIIVLDSGQAAAVVMGWQQGTIGPILGGEQLGEAAVEIVRRRPLVGGWGTSKTEEIAGPIVEIAHRLSEMSATLDMSGRPIPVVTAEDADLNTLYQVDAGDTAEERARKVQAGLQGDLGKRVLNLPAGLGTLDLVQPDVSGVTVGLDEADQLTRAVRDLSSIPSLTGSWTPASGESLKRQLYPLYFETKAMQMSLASAVSRLLGIDVAWEHIFDVLEMEARAREDEQDARALTMAMQGGPVAEASG